MTYSSKQLGKDAELAAQEIIRRAERGIGVAIRKGQEEGTIAKKVPFGNQKLRGDQVHPEQAQPLDFASRGELYGGNTGHLRLRR